MEAKGHESIINKLLELGFEELITGFRDFEIFTDSIYLGNWISDMSQFTGADIIEKFVLSEEKIKTINFSLLKQKDFIKDKKKLIHEEIAEYVKNSPVGEVQKFFYTLSNLSGNIIEIDFAKDLTEGIKQLCDYIVELIFKLIDKLIDFFNKLKIIIKNYSEEKQRERLKIIFTSLVKLIGVNKFTVKGTEGKIPFDLYNELFNKNFNEYYPHEHLDRPFDFQNVRQCPQDFYKSLDYRKPKNEQRGLYLYLEENLDVLKGWLSKISLELTNKESSSTHFHDLLTKTGRCLHIVEDFYAHSTFVHNSILDFEGFMDKLNGEEVIKVKNAIVELDEKNSNKDGRKNPVFSFLNLFRKEKKYESGNLLFTGFFGSEDAKTSLFHVLTGIIKEKYDLTDLKDKTTTEILKQRINANWNEKIEKRYLEFYSKEGEAWNLKSIEDSTFKYEDIYKITGNETNNANTIDHILFFSLNLGFVFITVKKEVEDFKKIIDDILTIVELLSIIGSVPKLLEKTIGSLGSLVSEEIIKTIKSWLFYDFIVDPVEKELNYYYGSHSLIAVDDIHPHKETLYNYTEKLATVADAVVLNLLFNKEKTLKLEQEESSLLFPDWEHFIDSFFRFPGSYDSPLIPTKMGKMTMYILDFHEINKKNYKQLDKIIMAGWQNIDKQIKKDYSYRSFREYVYVLNKFWLHTKHHFLKGERIDYKLVLKRISRENGSLYLKLPLQYVGSTKRKIKEIKNIKEIQTRINKQENTDEDIDYEIALEEFTVMSNFWFVNLYDYDIDYFFKSSHNIYLGNFKNHFKISDLDSLKETERDYNKLEKKIIKEYEKCMNIILKK